MSDLNADSAPERIIVISGGTDGMGRALALARARGGDHVIVLGSNPDKGRRIVEEAARADVGHRIEFIRADLATVAGTRAAIGEIVAHHQRVDALCLFANRQSPQRVVTAEGFERTFALYYLSRYLLSHELGALLHRSPEPVIVNIAGVGTTKGAIHWDDLHLEHKYRNLTAQLQAGRANDLLGVAFAERPGNPVHYVLFHPGFTKSGDLSPLTPVARTFIRLAASVAGRPIERAIAPLHSLIDSPPTAALTAIDRGAELPLTLPTLDPTDAERLALVTRSLLENVRPRAIPKDESESEPSIYPDAPTTKTDASHNHPGTMKAR